MKIFVLIIIAIILSIIIFIGILNSIFNYATDCCDYLYTKTIEDNLYLEKYRTYCAGVYGGELYTYYVTDSLKFRVKIYSHDEHSDLEVTKKENKIFAYNIESYIVLDTLNKTYLSKQEILSKKYFDFKDTVLKPLFGKSKILCNNFQYLHTYEIDVNSFYISSYQYHCGNEYINTIIFTDSSNINLLLGFEIPGEPIDYKANVDKNGNFEFYETQSRWRYDSVETKVFNIYELKSRKFEKICD